MWGENRRKRTVVWLSIVTMAMMALTGLSLAAGGAGATPVAPTAGTGAAINAGPTPSVAGVTSSSLGVFTPTFVGPAATGCAFLGCSLLSGPYGPFTPSMSVSSVGFSPATAGQGFVQPSVTTVAPQQAAARAAAHTSGTSPDTATTSDPSFVPTVSCQPLGPGCDTISSSSGGATGVRGLNAVSSASLYGFDIEPADQGVCAGNGYVVESNNIGEVQFFNPSLSTHSPPIALDSLMGLTSLGWSSGGDISCLYDYSNGGHWFITEFASPVPESAGGIFAGCFAGAPYTCYEAIAVSVTSDPTGAYNVYFLNANYNPYEPGFPYELNDFAKIATTRDSFLIFYDEFPLFGGGFGNGFFNGAQQFAFTKNAMEMGLPTVLGNGHPNPRFNVAIMNMGYIPTPDGICPADNVYGLGGITCWYQVIPAAAPDPTQWDNHHGGSGFMLESLDFYGAGDNRIAAFDWTDLSALNSYKCHSCSGIQFGGQLFSGVESYFDPGLIAPQKAGWIPLGHDCGPTGANLSTLAKCPEGGIATNGDGFTQVSVANGQIYGGISTLVMQTYASGPGCPCSEPHMGVAYYVIGTHSFDRSGWFTMTNQAYVSAMHEELEFPAIAAEGTASQDGGNGGAILAFSLSGNGGPTHADQGGYFPSTAWGWITPTSNGLVGSMIHIADKGLAAQDGFSEYQGLPGPTRPRWGDYSAAVFVPGHGTYFSTNYIQYHNCGGSAFTMSIGTCGGHRNFFANWGTSVNFVPT